MASLWPLRKLKVGGVQGPKLIDVGVCPGAAQLKTPTSKLHRVTLAEPPSDRRNYPCLRAILKRDRNISVVFVAVRMWPAQTVAAGATRGKSLAPETVKSGRYAGP